MSPSQPRLGAVLLCVALLGCSATSGCGEGSPETSPTATTAASVTSPEAENAAAGESPESPATDEPPSSAPSTSTRPLVPREPTAARSQTPEGAAALVSYYVDVLDRAFQFGDATALGAYEGLDCVQCSAWGREIAALGAKGQRAGGTAYTVAVGKPRSVGGGRYEVPVTLTRAAAPLLDGSGATVGALRASTTQPVVVLDWTGMGWQVSGIEERAPSRNGGVT